MKGITVLWLKVLSFFTTESLMDVFIVTVESNVTWLEQDVDDFDLISQGNTFNR